jgi:AcrR family transcriptional regulator
MRPGNSSKSEKILESAAHLFAQQGYHGTSTREIALKAQVSENTLFRYFARKEDLFWSALRSRTALIARSDLFSDSRGNEAPEVVLPKILQLLTETVNSRSEILRLIAIAHVELQANAEEHCEDFFSPFFSEISEYLAKSVAKGEVVKVDPSLLATCLMGMVFMHPQFSKFTAGNIKSNIDSKGAASAYSKFWLDILIPRSPAAIPSH